MARSVADVAAVLDAIAGFDPDDPTSLRAPSPACRQAVGSSPRSLRVGVDDAYVSEHTQPEITAAFRGAVKCLGELGVSLVPVTVPSVADVLPAWPILCGVEALEGHKGLFPERAAEYGMLFRTFLEWAASLGAAAVADAWAKRAAWVKRFDAVFDAVDVLACPSAAMVTLPAAVMRFEAPFTPAIAPFMRFTAPADFSGHPTLSIPYGDPALPDSLQLVGRRCDEAALCRLGHAFEQAVGRPPLPAT